MGFFGSGDKIQSQTTDQTGASEQAITVSGTASVGLRDDATFIHGGTGSVQKIGSTEVNYGAGNVTYGIPAGDVTTALSNVTLGIGDIVKKQADAASGQISSVLSSLSDLAMSKQTDGASVKDNTITWIVLGVCGLLTVILLWRK